MLRNWSKSLRLLEGCCGVPSVLLLLLYNRKDSSHSLIDWSALAKGTVPKRLYSSLLSHSFIHHVDSNKHEGIRCIIHHQKEEEDTKEGVYVRTCNQFDHKCSTTPTDYNRYGIRFETFSQAAEDFQ